MKITDMPEHVIKAIENLHAPRQADAAAGSAWAVFQINARSLNEAIVDALRNHYDMVVSDEPTKEDLQKFEGAELLDAHRLTDEELDRLTYHEENVDADTFEPIFRSFREELERRVADGTAKLGMFASTECRTLIQRSEVVYHCPSLSSFFLTLSSSAS
jgi:hypothetical protein